MAIPPIYQQKDSWPHLFVRTDTIKHFGEGQMARLQYCRECKIEWWEGRDSRPVGACPARNDRKEYRRLLG